VTPHQFDRATAAAAAACRLFEDRLEVCEEVVVVKMAQICCMQCGREQLAAVKCCTDMTRTFRMSPAGRRAGWLHIS